jgi:hypothetical protein
MVRRLLSNQILLREFNIDASAVLKDINAQNELLKRLLPLQVEQGPSKSQTFKWMATDAPTQRIKLHPEN